MLKSKAFTSAPTAEVFIAAPDAGFQIVAKRSYFSASTDDLINYLSGSIIVWQQHPIAGSGHVAVDNEILFAVADGTALTITTASALCFVGVRFEIIPTRFDPSDFAA